MFSFTWEVNNQNKRINILFKEGVVNFVDTQKQRNSEDFISIADAQQQSLLQTGRTVSQSTALRWVAENNLGDKLPGKKGSG